MGAVVQYRDLPGGPTELRLCIDLNRSCLCTNCGMLSMSMLKDGKWHMFCKTCLMERSGKYNSEYIYCKHENKEVCIFEMFRADGFIEVLRDIHVFCPNPKCKINVLLQDLKEHYVQCKQTVTCSAGDREVQSTEWSLHECCHERGACKTPAKEAPQRGDRLKQALLPQKSASVNATSTRNHGETSRSVYRSNDLQKAQNQTTTKGDAENTRFSPNGAREIEARKVPVLQRAFSEGPLPCVYCGQTFTKEEIETHFEACKQNLDNFHKEEYRRRSEETLPGATAHVGCPRTKGALTSCLDAELREVPEDSRVWLQCLSSGNVFAAFAAFEQSCSGKNLSEAAMCTQFVFALVDSKLFELVRDILEDPCQTQPLDCLMVALFARVSLPRKMWAKKIEEVTWDDVLKYLPSVLASRVTQTNVMSYLRNYPVFFD